jgi:hypothetical protein
MLEDLGDEITLVACTNGWISLDLRRMMELVARRYLQKF